MLIEIKDCQIAVRQSDSCEWHCVDSKFVNGAKWAGKCGAVWSFFDGTPKENGMNFCPFCGKKLIEKENNE